MNSERFEARMNQVLYRLLTAINNRSVENLLERFRDHWCAAIHEYTPENFQVNDLVSLWREPLDKISKTAWDEFEPQIEQYQSDLSRYHVLYSKSQNFDAFMASLRKLMLKAWDNLCQCVMRQEVAKFETIVRYE